ncbi:MAG TPA: SusC/RagA family TonB-linked outer membrane protein [Prolixibacteraceae bacterium]|nr:SusC/RagA family TonB-linked outer membrane protein [Prolixibacteraceae bacterium]
MKRKLLIGLVLMFSGLITLKAQTITVSGNVKNSSGESLPGVTVLEKNSSNGRTTDMDGNYTIQVKQNATLVFSFIGYHPVEEMINNRKTINVTLKESITGLEEVVAIGYGSTRKGDLTGSVSNVSSKDFNMGLINTPAQLVNGKVSGVQIMSSNGSPTSGNTIRIRGGASLNASNDPLIVLDGVPLETGGISGNSSNFLSLINPNDIESMTVLKDASSTAIYGSRASNGVIIITTKKGSGSKSGKQLDVSFSTSNSVQMKTKLADMLSRDEFINVVSTEGSDRQKSLLGNENTDWNNEIYQAAFGTDNNLSIAGKVKNIPFRVALGYYNQNGILNTDNATRETGNFSVSPSFFNDYLKFNLSIKGTLNQNRFANTGAIWGGTTYNPTIGVYASSNAFGGYNEAIDNTGTPVTGAVINPVGLLEQYSSTSNVNRVIGNFDVDYKMHFLPELKFHATLGYDYAQGEGTITVPIEAAQFYTTGGRNYNYGPQKKSNKLFTSYFNYNKSIESINSTIDATVGYDYQFWKSTSVAYDVLNVAGLSQSTTAATDARHALVSFYGRLNYSYASKYMITATIRRDGTSRFSEDNRWGMFPSVALGWRISEESFMKNISALSNLKLRASYGVTGQQDGIGDYGYLPVYTISQTGAEYLFGDKYYFTYRPEAYISNLKWETTTAFNYGLDFGFFKDRLSGSIDYYTRQTKDLLAKVPAAAGTNFDKTILTNVGNVDSKGIEVALNVVPIDNKNITWEVSFNGTWMQQTIKNLSMVKGGAITNTMTGPTIDSYTFQVLTEGYAPYMFYVYHQLYEESGKPIEDAYADVNKDGKINADDLYRYHSPSPDYILGFSTSLRYKNWNLSTSLRANIGNYVYNGMSMNTGAFNTMSYNDYQLNNLNKSYLKTGFQSRQYLSDYYVENASFLKMDNLSLGYNVGKISDLFRLNLAATVQNVFTITKYTGVDPEVPNGMDVSFYPRPRIYSLSVGIEF